MRYQYTRSVYSETKKLVEVYKSNAYMNINNFVIASQSC